MELVRKSAQLTAALALLASAGMANAVNLVANPSFELGDFDDADVALVPHVTEVGGNQSGTKITGWTVSNNSLIWIDNAYAGPLSTPKGTKFLDLTAYTNLVSRYASIGQDVATAVGTSYTLSFELGSSKFFDVLPVIALSTAGVTVNFAVTATPTANSQWTSFAYNFTATSAFTPITFTGIQGSDYIGLDNISVSAVPEPTSVAMLLAGLVAMGSAAIRHRSNFG